MNNDRFKFRGRRIEDGEWVIGNLIQTNNKQSFPSHENDMFTNNFIEVINDNLDIQFVSSPKVSIDTEVYRIDPKTLGQCTGLRDKNGVLIFEGDKLFNEYISIVVWDKCSSCWSMENENGDFEYNFSDFYDMDEFEIIGNVHEEGK
jgi:hypothetical protein